MADLRNSTLQSIHQEHKQTLAFCWRIRQGISNSIDYQRIINYTSWFYRTHLTLHFDKEEKYIFPILDKESEITKRALSEHRKLKRLFETRTEAAKYLTRIEEALESHIRYEERVLFMKIEEIASQEDISKILSMDSDKEQKKEWNDPFWEI